MRFMILVHREAVWAPQELSGTKQFQKNPELLDLLDGLHFHTLCEQDSDDLETTLVSVKKHFGDLASQSKVDQFWRWPSYYKTRI